MANSVDPDQTAPRSSLFWVHAVCFYTKFISNARQLFAANNFSRRHFQMHFFLGPLRAQWVNTCIFDLTKCLSFHFIIIVPQRKQRRREKRKEKSNTSKWEPTWRRMTEECRPMGGACLPSFSHRYLTLQHWEVLCQCLCLYTVDHYWSQIRDLRWERIRR